MTPSFDRSALVALGQAMVGIHRILRRAAGALARGEAIDRAAAPGDSVFESLHRLARESGLEGLHRARLDEMRLELECVHAVGEGRRRAHALRYGEPSSAIADEHGRPTTLESRALALALAMTEGPIDSAEPPVADPVAILRASARAAGLSIRIEIEPSLVADAASGDHTLFLAPRSFRRRDLVRLAAHEILGHLTASANADVQPLALLRIGTAESWDDQEGVALALERRAGAFGAERMRQLGARALAALVFVRGGEAIDARIELASLGLPEATIERAVARAFRAGGTARDLAYLRGLGRVEACLRESPDSIDALRIGRVSVASLALLEPLARHGLVRAPVHRPSLASSLLPTLSGTSFETSPPSRAASFTRFDAT